MGVPQFLSEVLKTAGRPIDLRSYANGIVGSSSSSSRRHAHDDNNKRRNLRIGVDVSTWIYKACQGYSDMLGDERHLTNYGRAELMQKHHNVHVEGTAQPVNTEPNDVMVQKYIATCVKYVTDRLLSLQSTTNAELLVVLDGATPPIKAREAKERRRRRQQAQQERDAHVDATGNAEAQERRIKAFRRAGAGEHYITVVTHLIHALRQEEIAFLVAPYESDGQLAWLSQQGTIDLIVTEDSDLIAYGASPILYKLSYNNNNNNGGGNIPKGILIRREDLAANPDKIDLSDFSPLMLAVLFVAVGSDYCQKLKGIGIVAACNIVRAAFLGRRHDDPLEVVFEKLFRETWEPSSKLTDSFKAEYKTNFLSALLMFRHPIIYDPIRNKCRMVGGEHKLDNGGWCDPELANHAPYTELCCDADKRNAILGHVYDSSMAALIAEGWISPRTKRPLEDDNDKLPGYVRQFLLNASAAVAGAAAAKRDNTIDELETQETQEALVDDTMEEEKDETNAVAHQDQKDEEETTSRKRKDKTETLGAAAASDKDPNAVSADVISSSTSGKRKLNDDDAEGEAPMKRALAEEEQEVIEVDDDDEEEQLYETQLPQFSRECDV